MFNYSIVIFCEFLLTKRLFCLFHFGWQIGGRLGYSIRGVMQSQSKSFVDVQHESKVCQLLHMLCIDFCSSLCSLLCYLFLLKMTKIKAVLDQETWVAVDVPVEFQAIIDSLSSTSSVENSIGVVESDNSLSKSVDYDVSSSQENGRDEQGPREDKRGESAGPVRSEENNARSTPQSIVHGGVSYHMVNW